MISFREKVRRVGVVAGVLMATACAGDPIAPAALRGAPEASPAKQSSVGSTATQLLPMQVHAVGRLGRLTQDLRTSATIGSAGGVLTLPGAGFKLIVPPGAVAAPTQFSVTAIAGRAVAYQFQPHGIQFAVPLTFMQDALFTNLGWGQTPIGAYFHDRNSINPRNGRAAVSEIIPAQVKGSWIEFSIRHFSGYLVSSM